MTLDIPTETAILVKIASLGPLAPSTRRNGNKDTIMRPRVKSKAPRSVNNTMEYVCAGIRTLNCLGEPCLGILSDAWVLRSQRSRITQSHNHRLIQHATHRMSCPPGGVIMHTTTNEVLKSEMMGAQLGEGLGKLWKNGLKVGEM